MSVYLYLGMHIYIWIIVAVGDLFKKCYKNGKKEMNILNEFICLIL